MVSFLAIVALVLFLMVLSLRTRVKRLEDLSGALPRTTPMVAQGGQPTPVVAQATSAPAGVPTIPAQSYYGGPSAGDRFIAWLKEDWLLKLGALLLLIGFGWLVSYAFLQNWIGPMGRIALGLCAGAGFLVGGWFHVRKYLQQGSVFLVLGSTVILLTVYAAREIYDFFTPLTALGIMFLSSAFVAFSSWVYQRQPLALASIALAGVAPLLTASMSPDYNGLFAYLLVVTLSTLWLVSKTGWRVLTAVALLIVGLYSLPHFSWYTGSDLGALVLFIYGFAGLFFVAATLGILRLPQSETKHDLFIAAGNGVLLISWILLAVSDEWKSLTMVAWMLVFVVGAFMVFRVTARKEPFYIYAGVGAALLAAATAQELEGPALTIAFTIEAVAVTLLSYMLLRDIKITERVSLLMGIPIFLAIPSFYAGSWSVGVIHDDFFVLLLLSVVLACIALFFYTRQEHADPNRVSWGSVFGIIASLFSYALIWLTLHALFLYAPDTATMVALLCYSVIGLACYFYGLVHVKKPVQMYGAVLLAFVVGRLFLVDVWNMELSGRIITFFLVGTLFMTAAVLARKKRGEVITPQQ
jgi:uncharacterized membrane protein